MTKALLVACVVYPLFVILAEKLGMDRDKAEVWIVNLIRQARLDARIDSQANQVQCVLPFVFPWVHV